MSRRKFYINNKECEPPLNAFASAIEFNFDKSADQVITIGAMNSDNQVLDYEFVRENAQEIFDLVEQNGTSISIPYKETVEDKQGVIQLFDAYLDMGDNPEFTKDLRPEKVVVRVKERMGPDWLEQKVAATTFEMLYQQGVITDADFQYMPYIVSALPDYFQASIMLLTATSNGFIIADQTQSLIEYTIEVANPLEFTATLKILGRVLFITLQELILFDAILDMISFLMQAVKYHACMYEQDLLRISVEHFGYRLKTDLYDDPNLAKIVVMPRKYSLPSTPSNISVLGSVIGFSRLGAEEPSIDQKGFEFKTVADFLVELKKQYRHKIVLTSDNEFIFIREDKSIGAPQFKMPDLFQPTFTYNRDELKGTYILSFAVDDGDKNTVQNYLGTSYQVITSNKNQQFPDLNNINGLEQVDIGYSLVATKKELTLVEEIVKLFLDLFGPIINLLIKAVNLCIKAVNAIKSLINKILRFFRTVGIKINFQFKPTPELELLPPGADIENRKGMLLLESDFVQVPRKFLMDRGSSPKYNKVSANNRQILSAKNLYNRFHAPVVSFLPSADRPYGNQYMIKPYKDIPFDSINYREVRAINTVLSVDGKECVVVRGKWQQEPGIAEMTIKIPYLYEPNLQETYIEPDAR